MVKRIVITLSVVGLLVTGYAGLSDTPAWASHNCGSDSIVLAANPELAAACRYHHLGAGYESEVSEPTETIEAESNDLTNSAFLAANPELNVVRGHTGAIEKQGSRPVTADLEALREFYANEWTVEADAIDPKPLVTPGNSGVEKTGAEASPLVQPVSHVVEMSEADFLAANPELKLVRRYLDASENRSNQPVTFDLEAVRKYYATEWTIEADAQD